MNHLQTFPLLLLALIGSRRTVDSFAIVRPTTAPTTSTTTTCLDASKIGIFFGTSTGNTESVAELLAERFETDPPMDIDAVQGKLADTISNYDALIVGTPTWNTGADTERSGTGWDETYYGEEFQSLSLEGKPVAVFGCGDSESYAENYCDGMGELHDVFSEKGATMLGYVSAVDGSYEHEESKAQHGDNFCGLALDLVNYEDMTEDRVSQWVEQLKTEGILEGASAGGSSSSSSTPVAAPAAPAAASDEATTLLLIQKLEQENAALREQLLAASAVVEVPATTGGDGYTPHYNAKTGSTMWTSPDGRKCYYTSSNVKSSP